MTSEQFLAEAQPDCPTCGGTGIIEGQTVALMTNTGDLIGSTKDAARVCYCVPLLIITASDPAPSGYTVQRQRRPHD